MTLAILDITEDPTLAFASVGRAGESLAAYVYSGQCRIDDAPDEKLLAKLARSSPVQLGFYVPGAGPFRPSYLLSSWAEVSLAKTEISSSNGLAQRGPYGVDAAAVQMVDDRGFGSQWPYLTFTAHGGEPMVIRYRLTVTQPMS